MKRSKCITCERPIEWAQTLRARVWIPLDPGPVADGNLELLIEDDAALIRVVPLEDRAGRDDLRQTHFVTCPDSVHHRRLR